MGVLVPILCGILLYTVSILVVSSVNFVYRSQQLSFCDKRKGNGYTPLYTLSEVRSSTECGIFCTNDLLCLSANYEKREELCHLHSTGHKDFESKCECLLVDNNAAFLYKEHPCYFQMPTGANGECICKDGFSGHSCENPPRDCNDFPIANERIGKIYLHPERCHGVWALCALNALTLFTSSAGHQTKQTWNDLKALFFTHGEFWWGTEQMHRITYQMHNYALYLWVLRKQGVVHTRLYSNFFIQNETNKYAFRYSQTCSNDGTGNITADNILSDGAEFHALDYNDEEGCATIHKAAFWYQSDCRYPAPLLGQYPFGGQLANISSIKAYLIRQTGNNVTIHWGQKSETWIASTCQLV